jgi:FKBP-type peptidyl-prolyl cis-trans isomerase
MKKIFAVTVLLALAFSPVVFAAEEGKTIKPKLETDSAKLGYALGLDIGANLQRLNADVDLDAFFQGVKDTLQGEKLLLTPAEAEQIKQEFFKKMREEREQKMKELGEKNLQEGKAFLEANKEKSGVVTTASGLQYIVLRKGDGPKPAANDQVKVQYAGTLIDGTEFDSSYKRGEPATFRVNGVIRGWSEAIQLMNVGSKYRLFIPSDLGYGERGAGDRIGPNATLIFEVELLNIEN